MMLNNVAKLKKTTGMSKMKRSEAIQCYLLLLPKLLGFFLFSAYPIFWAARFAFYFYEGAVADMRFVGLENFINAFHNELYWKSWITTFKFAIVKLPIELPLAMFLAVLVNRKMKGVGFYRAMYFLPHMISVAVIGLILNSMFDYFGVINAWIVKLGIVSEPIEWFADGTAAFWVLVIGNIWNSFGINVLYFLAALQNVPEELHEAAYLDGATKWITFRKVTLPLMASVLRVVMLLAINGSLHTNQFVLVTTGGAPAGETFTVNAYMTQTFAPGFAEGVVNIGYGCALSIITSIIMCVIAIVYSKLSAKASQM